MWTISGTVVFGWVLDYFKLAVAGYQRHSLDSTSGGTDADERLSGALVRSGAVGAAAPALDQHALCPCLQATRQAFRSAHGKNRLQQQHLYVVKIVLNHRTVGIALSNETCLLLQDIKQSYAACTIMCRFCLRHGCSALPVVHLEMRRCLPVGQR